ncbi:MAG: 50S ribosomal protein L10 [Pirellulales bacterium]|nr:50S ribosomal protein L10 [Pirellulales bacterium]
MSRHVKELIVNDLKQRLDGVNDLVLVSLAGMTANNNYRLRKELRDKKINVLVVKNSLARLATEGTVLAPAFEGAAGSTAIAWGSEDIVSLCKEIARAAGDKANAPFEARGGVMDGSRLAAGDVEKVSKWPSRHEQLCILVGQILGPGSTLAAQLSGPGGALASQIKSRAEGDDAGGDAPAAEEAAPAAES